MATPEFEQTGSTSGQRLAALNATEVPGKPGRPPNQAIDIAGVSAGADRFVAGFLRRTPEALDRAPESSDPFEGYSTPDLAQALRRLSNRGSSATMDANTADAATKLKEEF